MAWSDKANLKGLRDPNCFDSRFRANADHTTAPSHLWPFKLKSIGNHGIPPLLHPNAGLLHWLLASVWCTQSTQVPYTKCQKTATTVLVTCQRCQLPLLPVPHSRLRLILFLFWLSSKGLWVQMVPFFGLLMAPCSQSPLDSVRFLEQLPQILTFPNSVSPYPFWGWEK